MHIRTYLKIIIVEMNKEELLNEIEEIRITCSHPDWDGYFGDPVHPKSIHYILKFIEKFPKDLPIPDASLTPTSTMGIEWIGKTSGRLWVTIDKDGLVYVVSAFDDKKDEIMSQYKFEDGISGFEKLMFDLIKKKF